MSVKRLCKLEDVLNEGNIPEDIHDMLIDYKIKDISEELASTMLDTASDYDKKKCCVFGVLAWMESNKLIEGSKEVISESEGDESVTYSSTGAALYNNPSYYGQYRKYYVKITKMVPPGKVVGTSLGRFI